MNSLEFDITQQLDLLALILPVFLAFAPVLFWIGLFSTSDTRSKVILVTTVAMVINLGIMLLDLTRRAAFTSESVQGLALSGLCMVGIGVGFGLAGALTRHYGVVNKAATAAAIVGVMVLIIFAYLILSRPGPQEETVQRICESVAPADVEDCAVFLMECEHLQALYECFVADELGDAAQRCYFEHCDTTQRQQEPVELSVPHELVNETNHGLPQNTDDSGNAAPEGFVLIPAGTFSMGSPSDEPDRRDDETQHLVTITHAFYLQEHEVTQAQWSEVMGNNPSYFSRYGDDHPVESVSWYDAVDYANALSSAEGLNTCYRVSDRSVTFQGLDCEGYRLPTEAEWEYAARAETTTAWSCGSVADCLYEIAWFGPRTSLGPSAVGRKQPNDWGLYDMVGNVWEWCWDWYDDSYYPSEPSFDPLGPETGLYRVVRGGSYDSHIPITRVSYRYKIGPQYRLNHVGFRLVRTGP